MSRGWTPEDWHHREADDDLDHWVANPSTSPECGGCGWPYDYVEPARGLLPMSAQLAKLLDAQPLTAVEQHVREANA